MASDVQRLAHRTAVGLAAQVAKGEPEAMRALVSLYMRDCEEFGVERIDAMSVLAFSAIGLSVHAARQAGDGAEFFATLAHEMANRS